MILLTDNITYKLICSKTAWESFKTCIFVYISRRMAMNVSFICYDAAGHRHFIGMTYKPYIAYIRACDGSTCLRPLKCSHLNDSILFQCMDKIFCVLFPRVLLKFYTKYLIHALRDMNLCNVEILRAPRLKSSYMFLKRPKVLCNMIYEYVAATSEVSLQLVQSPTLLKDLSMMYRALWDRRHEGATRIRQCTRRYAPRALTDPRGPFVPPISQCTIHHASIRLWHDLFGFDTLRSQNLQAKFRRGRWRIMHCRKSMHGFVGHVHSNAFVTS